jgi:hypothetical protein
VDSRSRCVSEAEGGKYTTLASRVPEYIVVLVTYHFRYLASAPKVRWRARAGALALGQEPKLLDRRSEPRRALNTCL